MLLALMVSALFRSQQESGLRYGDLSLSRCGASRYFFYALRRVDCPACGIRVERMPWVAGKNRLTEAYGWFLLGWAQRLSWKEVAESFRTTWDHVLRIG